jgi:hypothetical protein
MEWRFGRGKGTTLYIVEIKGEKKKEKERKKERNKEGRSISRSLSTFLNMNPKSL